MSVAFVLGAYRFRAEEIQAPDGGKRRVENQRLKKEGGAFLAGRDQLI